MNTKATTQPQELDLSQLQDVAGGQSVPVTDAELPNEACPVDPNPGGYPVL